MKENSKEKGIFHRDTFRVWRVQMQMCLKSGSRLEEEILC